MPDDLRKLEAEKAAAVEMQEKISRAFKSFGAAIAASLAPKVPIKVTKCECCGEVRTPNLEGEIKDAIRRGGIRRRLATRR